MKRWMEEIPERDISLTVNMCLEGATTLNSEGWGKAETNGEVVLNGHFCMQKEGDCSHDGHKAMANNQK